MLRKASIISVFIILSVCLLLLPSFTINPERGLYIDKVQGQKAFIQLNKVRQDPNAYTERYEVSLKGISPRPNLQWNDSLAAVAERKAMSMASRGYFDHVNPDGYGINYYVNKAYPLPDDQIKDKKQSTLEAIEGGAPSGEVAIKNIITDKAKLGTEGRKLLLGEGDFNASLTGVGIGYVHGTGSTKYWSYTCVIIAKPR
jgi:hypothetical protein